MKFYLKYLKNRNDKLHNAKENMLQVTEQHNNIRKWELEEEYPLARMCNQHNKIEENRFLY